jgi:hypothetical protein
LRNHHLSYVQLATTVKSTVEILQNFVAFSEYMNFMCDNYLPALFSKVELSLKNKGDNQVFPTSANLS